MLRFGLIELLGAIVIGGFAVFLLGLVFPNSPFAKLSSYLSAKVTQIVNGLLQRDPLAQAQAAINAQERIIEQRLQVVSKDEAAKNQITLMIERKRGLERTYSSDIVACMGQANGNPNSSHAVTARAKGKEVARLRKELAKLEETLPAAVTKYDRSRAKLDLARIEAAALVERYHDLEGRLVLANLQNQAALAEQVLTPNTIGQSTMDNAERSVLEKESEAKHREGYEAGEQVDPVVEVNLRQNVTDAEGKAVVDELMKKALNAANPPA
jgi:hypothetical protein